GDVLDHERTALLVEPGNVNELVTSIVHLVDNPDEAVRLGTNAREEVLKKHTWTQHAENIVRAFEYLKR
ncbi:glycosyltransferase, partial [Candidatus Latescibacterota bacterium]